MVGILSVQSGLFPYTYITSLIIRIMGIFDPEVHSKNATLYLRDITIYIKMGTRYLFASKSNCWCNAYFPFDPNSCQLLQHF